MHEKTSRRRVARYHRPMDSNLVFITGGSSGIGAALTLNVPFANARVIDISRRGASGCEHFDADLANPTEWAGVADLFAREIKDFNGERIVFIHCAGTLQPIGYAGEGPPDAYARQVLLNSASPQVLGDAFLRAAAQTSASCHILMISSGAATNIYEGWSAYGPGKAAMDHWVRTAGAEQERRGGRCRILSVAPGIVSTSMQEEIRCTSKQDFPEVERFIELHENDELRAPHDVAREIWALLEQELENGCVMDLRG